MPPYPIVVIGGSPAGMAAAARLAKLRHPVLLLERRAALGGRYAAHPLACGAGTATVDDLPGVLTFPAPWRDLFHKTGRSLEAELERRGLALVPAPATRHRFDDGLELDLAADRGLQHQQLEAAFGAEAARHWQRLMDRLDEVWQVVRRLGLEQDLTGRDQIRAAHLDRMLGRAPTIERLARTVPDPHLATLIRDVARRLGSEPSRTPAWCAVQLSVERQFGRWLVASAAGTPVRTGELVETLTARLDLRQVEIRTGVEAAAISPASDRNGLVVSTSAGPQQAAAVVAAVHPWALARLARDVPGARTRAAAAHRLRPATAPDVSHRCASGHAAGGSAEASEEVEHTASGPVITWRRRTPDGLLTTVHDWSAAHPDPSAGIAWDGPRSWLRRPAIRTCSPGLYTAGPHSRGGPLPYAEVLSGALAAYACHADLTGVDPNPYAPGN